MFIPAYYADLLLAKLDNLKQYSMTVKEYFHDFKICVMFDSLDEYRKDTMRRFIKDLNSEIQMLLICQTYSSISHLFLLGCNAQNQLLSFKDSSMNNHHDRFVECIADRPSSQI